jgi:hypothetical protein
MKDENISLTTLYILEIRASNVRPDLYRVLF